MQPTQVPADVVGARVRYAEHQPQYTPIDTVRRRDREYGCWRLVTSFVPDEQELHAFANAVLDAMPERDVPVLPSERAMIDALRAAFTAKPVLMAQLSGDAVMTPHNLHLGTAHYLKCPE